MKIDTQIDNEKNLRTHTVTGIFHIDELANMLVELYKSSEHIAKMNALWDLRDADFSELSTQEVESLSNTIKQSWGKGKQKAALVVTDRALDFGMSRMYEILMDGNLRGNIKVFKGYAEAATWLFE